MKSLSLVLGAVLVLVGCDHKLQMVVNNTTPETRDLAVGLGGQKPRHVGVVPAGRSWKQTYKFSKDGLPTELRWTCGSQQGRETITAQQKKLVINIERDAAIVTDGNAEIDRHVESHEILEIRSGTVIE